MELVCRIAASPSSAASLVIQQDRIASGPVHGSAGLLISKPIEGWEAGLVRDDRTSSINDWKKVNVDIEGVKAERGLGETRQTEGKRMGNKRPRRLTFTALHVLICILEL